MAEPQRERLRAVRKLAESGDLARARQRLAVLSAEFPNFKPLLGLALSNFLAGAPTRAIEAAEAAWQAHPTNVFALDLLARARCWLEGLVACAPLAELARRTVPLRAEDANARVSLLRWLGDEAAAQRAHAECADAEYWREAEPRLLDRFDQLAHPVRRGHGNPLVSSAVAPAPAGTGRAMAATAFRLRLAHTLGCAPAGLRRPCRLPAARRPAGFCHRAAAGARHPAAAGAARRHRGAGPVAPTVEVSGRQERQFQGGG